MFPLRRTLLPLGLLLGAASASGCSGFAETVCARQEAIAEAVHEAADYVGPIGHIFDQAAGLFLDVLCAGVVEIPCALTDAGASAIGIIDDPSAVEPDTEGS